MKEIKRVPYAKAVDNINDFNSKQAASQQKLDGMPIEEMNNYIVMFPAKNPKLLNYEQLNKIRYMMFVASREIDEPLKEPTQETLLSLTKGLYSLLKDAEESNNKKYINAILRAGKDLRPEDYGFTTRKEDSVAKDPLEDQTVPSKAIAEKLSEMLGCSGAHKIGDAWGPCESEKILKNFLNLETSFREWKKTKLRKQVRSYLKRLLLRKI